jgi:hypothetical protein
MRKLALLACSSAMLIAAPATAAVTFELKDVTLQGGATLIGDFTTSDDLKTLLGVDITAMAGDFNGRHFDQTTYDFADVTSDRLPINSSIRLDVGGNELQLAFGDLTAAGATLSDPNSSEHSQLAGNRLVTGGSIVAEVAVAAVPEPATWVMMIGGLGLVGGALRRPSNASRRRTA